MAYMQDMKFLPFFGLKLFLTHVIGYLQRDEPEPKDEFSAPVVLNHDFIRFREHYDNICSAGTFIELAHQTRISVEEDDSIKIFFSFTPPLYALNHTPTPAQMLEHLSFLVLNCQLFTIDKIDLTHADIKHYLLLKDEFNLNNPYKLLLYFLFKQFLQSLRTFLEIADKRKHSKKVPLSEPPPIAPRRPSAESSAIAGAGVASETEASQVLPTSHREAITLNDIVAEDEQTLMSEYVEICAPGEQEVKLIALRKEVHAPNAAIETQEMFSLLNKCTFKTRFDLLVLFHTLHTILVLEFEAPSRILAEDINQEKVPPHHSPLKLRLLLYYLYLLAYNYKKECPQAMVLYLWFRFSGIANIEDKYGAKQWLDIYLSYNDFYIPYHHQHNELYFLRFVRERLHRFPEAATHHKKADHPNTIMKILRGNRNLLTNLLCIRLQLQKVRGELYIKHHNPLYDFAFQTVLHNWHNIFDMYFLIKFLIVCERQKEAVLFSHHLICQSFTSEIWENTGEKDPYIALFFPQLIYLINPSKMHCISTPEEIKNFKETRASRLGQRPISKMSAHSLADISPGTARKDSASSIGSNPYSDGSPSRSASAQDILQKEARRQSLIVTAISAIKWRRKSDPSVKSYQRLAWWIYLNTIDTLTPELVFKGKTAAQHRDDYFKKQDDIESFLKDIGKSETEILAELLADKDICESESRPVSVVDELGYVGVNPVKAKHMLPSQKKPVGASAGVGAGAGKE